MNDSSFKVTFTTLPSIYQKAYHESLGISGLHYIALGVGIMMTAQVTARALDWSLAYYTKKNGGSMQPEYRLRKHRLPLSCDADF